MRKKIIKVAIHLLLVIVCWGFLIPNLISASSTFLVIVGLALVIAYIIYYTPIIYQFLNKKL